MPPKGRKSLSNSWYTCEACGVYITHKDLQQHKMISCPPHNTKWEHAFIQNNVFYSFIEVGNINDAPKLNAYEQNFFVYLSHSVMQICHFEIGEQVILTGPMTNNDSIIRTVWPTEDRTLTSVVVTQFNTGNCLKSFEESNMVKVEKLPRKPIPALSINLYPDVELDLKSVDKLVVLCKQLYIGKLLQNGSVINITFYGKSINLYVEDIEPAENKTQDLILQLDKLQISTFDTKLYFVVETSKWQIHQKVKYNKKELNLNKITLKKIGGYKEIIQELLSLLSLALKKNDSPLHFSSSLGILLYGPSGVGKTYIAEAISNEMGVHITRISSGELFSKFYGETELRLRKLFMEAKDKSPSIIILDNVDTLCPKRGGTEQERRVIAYLLTLIDSLKEYKTVVLAITSQLNLIDSSLRRPGRLDCEIELPIPSTLERFDILKILLSTWNIKEFEVMNIAEAAHGYVAADLHCLVTKALMQAISQNRNNVEASHLIWALPQIKPSAMREVLVQVPNVKWTDIGGMDDLKLKLQQAIEWPLRHPGAFSRLGIKPPHGVLMYGPPGCSKTMIAKALATESKLNFLSIKGSELFSKWVGESEKAVQSLFKKARAVAPSIIFLDELDALGGERSGSNEGSNVQERVLAQLLIEMDGVEPLGNVNIVAATNRPDRVDKALLRPGRLDRLVYVPLPDLATRISILQLQLVKMPVARDIVIDDLARKTDGYSGAEVIAVCHEAAINALQEDLNVDEICDRHFLAALKLVKPRTPHSLLKLYDNYLKS